MWERGRPWGEEASIGGWEQGCSLVGGNRGAGRGDLGCRGNTFSLVLLPGSSRVRDGNIGIGRAGGGAWLAWCSRGRRKKLGYVRIPTIPPHLNLVGAGVFGGIRSWIAIYYPSGNSLHNYARDICHHGGEHISESKLPE